MNEFERRARASKAEQEARATCELCGTPKQELRPFGPKGEHICFKCGMKNKATTERQFRRRAFGETIN